MSIAKPTDDELRELFFLYASGDRAVSPRTPSVEQLRLSDEQLDDFVSRIGNIEELGRRQWVRKELAEAAQYFCDAYFFQIYPSPSETARKFKSIQSAARTLAEALSIESDSPALRAHDIRSYMQIAVDEYGGQVGIPKELLPHGAPWNFWSAYKLPSAVSGVQLIDHWAGIALKELSRTIARNKASGQTGHRGKAAVRALIHQMALAWLHGTGQPPGDSTDGPFIRLVVDFTEAMKMNITKSQSDHLLHLGNTLSVSPLAIRNHLRRFLARLAASAANQAAKSKRKEEKSRHEKN